MNKGNLIWGIVCLLIAGGLTVANLALPAEKLMFQVGDINMPWVPPVAQLLAGRWPILVLLSILVLALWGQMPMSQAGWITNPPRVVILPARAGRRIRRGLGASIGTRLRQGRQHLARTGHLVVIRSVLLGALWWSSGAWGPGWVVLCPTALWLWQAAGALWPGRPAWSRPRPSKPYPGCCAWNGSSLGTGRRYATRRSLAPTVARRRCGVRVVRGG